LHSEVLCIYLDTETLRQQRYGAHSWICDGSSGGSSAAIATSREGPSLPSRGPIKREHYVFPITLDCAYQ
jgi:hypothetical protein